MLDVTRLSQEEEEFAKKLGWDGFYTLSPQPVKGRWILETEWKSLEDLKEVIRKNRKKVPIWVNGSGLKANRMILSLSGISFIRALKLDYVAVRLASKNGIRIVFDFNQLLLRSGSERARIWSKYWQVARLVRKYKAPFALVTLAGSRWELRSPSELLAFGRKLGFQDPEIKTALQIESLSSSSA